MLDSLFEKETQAKELADVIEKITLMKKAILARAFRGELGTNAPEEESALGLLKEVLEGDCMDKWEDVVSINSITSSIISKLANNEYDDSYKEFIENSLTGSLSLLPQYFLLAGLVSFRNIELGYSLF